MGDSSSGNARPESASRARRIGRFGAPLLAAGSVVATLAVCELALRAYAWKTREPGRAAALARPLPPGTRVTLGEILRPSPERRIVYELKPQLDVVFEGARLTTDAQGFRRGSEGPADGPLFRVVGLGDSYMFGWGVSDDETYLALLAARLRDRFPSRSWQVVNTAVPGYNTAMELATLEHKALSLQPRLVVLEMVGNDLDLPNFIRTEPAVWSARRSFVLELVARRLRTLRRGQAPRDDDAPLTPAPQAGGPEPPHFEDDPSRVPPAYADLVGWDAVEGSLRRLAQLRDQHGFAVVVLSEAPGFDWFQHRTRRLARSLAFAYVDVGPTIRRRVADGGYGAYQDSPLARGRADPHPSPLGHELACDELFRALVEGGFVTQ